MPYSSAEGKQLVLEFFANKKIEFVIDVGPGSGTYVHLLQPVIDASWWTGVEIWAPYVEKFDLDTVYNEIIIADVNWLDWGMIGFPDIVIFGDVLEHMSVDAAVRAVARAQAISKYVVIALPIIPYPQGAHFDNEYESHLVTYSKDSVREVILDDYEILSYDEGEVTGTYIIAGKQIPVGVEA